MKQYIINEERLRELLYDHYVLNCLYEAGVDNWDGFMINRTQYINEMLGVYNIEDFDEDADFDNIVDLNLTEYEELITRR